MDATIDLGTLAATLVGSLLAAQQEARPPLPQRPLEVVLSDAEASVPVADFQLGDGGVATPRAALRLDANDGCVTPGGVHVACRSAGVKLTFPSGRELLVAPDGRMHLRGGEHSGTFPAGLALRLADGVEVRIVLAQGSRHRVREVHVVDGERALQLWHRGRESRDEQRARGWAGVQVACCGDGGAIYRPLAIGPLVVLERLLVPEDRQHELPEVRLVVLRSPLHASLRTMQRQHREPDAAVRKAVAAVAAVAQRADEVLPAGAALRRADHRRLRWLLPHGFELQLELDGSQLPRLQLFVGRRPLPMVEWTLASTAVAFLNNPRDDRLGKRWHGNGTRLPAAAVDLQVRDHLHERQQALRALARLQLR